MGLDLNRFRGGGRGQEWLDWLSDDPIPSSVRDHLSKRANAPKRAEKKAQQQKVEKGSTTAPSVSINITLPGSLPKLKKPQVKLPKFVKELPPLPMGFSYKQLAITALVGSSVIIGSLVFMHLSDGKKKPAGQTGVLSAESQKPEFKVVVPSGNAAEAGDQRYDSKRKVVSFKDTVGGVEVTVSEQPLPESMKDNADDKVKKLAESFSAKDVLSTASPTAYLGTSVKGPQTVIFTKNGLLIFIQSVNNIDKHDWADYITRLK